MAYETASSMPSSTPGCRTCEDYIVINGVQYQEVTCGCEPLQKPHCAKAVDVPNKPSKLLEKLRLGTMPAQASLDLAIGRRSPCDCLQTRKQLDNCKERVIPKPPPRCLHGKINPAYLRWKRSLRVKIEPKPGQIRTRYDKFSKQTYTETYNGRSYEVNPYSFKSMEAHKTAIQLRNRASNVESSAYISRRVQPIQSPRYTYKNSTGRGLPSFTGYHNLPRVAQKFTAQTNWEAASRNTPISGISRGRTPLARAQWETVRQQQPDMLKRLASQLRYGYEPFPAIKDTPLSGEDEVLMIGKKNQITCTLHFKTNYKGLPEPVFTIKNRVTGMTVTVHSDHKAKQVIHTMWNDPEVQAVERGGNGPIASNNALQTIAEQEHITHALHNLKQESFSVADKWAKGALPPSELNAFVFKLEASLPSILEARTKLPIVADTVVNELANEGDIALLAMVKEFKTTDERLLLSIIPLLLGPPIPEARQEMYSLLFSQSNNALHDQVLADLLNGPMPTLAQPEFAIAPALNEPQPTLADPPPESPPEPQPEPELTVPEHTFTPTPFVVPPLPDPLEGPILYPQKQSPAQGPRLLPQVPLSPNLEDEPIEPLIAPNQVDLDEDPILPLLAPSQEYSPAPLPQGFTFPELPELKDAQKKVEAMNNGAMKSALTNLFKLIALFDPTNPEKMRQLQQTQKEKEKEKVLDAVKNDGYALEHASDEFKKDREIVSAAVAQNGDALLYADDEFTKNREIVSAAVTQNGLLLEYASDEFKKDKKIVLAAVQQNGLALKYASDEFTKNREIVLAAVTQNRYALYYASDEFKKDEEIVLAAVKNDGFALDFASDEFKKDKKIVLAAVKQFGEALEYASFELKNNEKIVLAAVTQNGLALKYASVDLRNNKKIVLPAVKQNGYALYYASDELKNDEEIVLTAVTQNGFALQYASDEFRKNKDKVLAAVTQSGTALKYASDEFKNDEEIVLTAVKQFGEALEYASVNLRNNKKIVLPAVTKYGLALKYASVDLRNNKKIVLPAVTQNRYALYYASDELKNDEEIVLAAVKNDGLALEYASFNLRNNKEIVSAAVTQNGEALTYASADLKKDPDIVKLLE